MFAFLRKNEKGYFFRETKYVVDWYRADLFGPRYYESEDDLPMKEVPGRFCFAVRGQDLCEGYAEVEIVEDRGTYCFFKGKMIQYIMPSDEELVKYLQDKDILNGTMEFRKNGLKGSYIILKDRRSVLYAGTNGKVYEIQEDFGSKFDKATEVYEISVRDFLAQKYWGDSLESLKKKFVPFQFDTVGNESIKFVNELFDEAIEYGIVTLRSAFGVNFVRFHEIALMDARDSFSREEIEQIFADASRLNIAANEAVASKIRKGKVSLVMSR